MTTNQNPLDRFDVNATEFGFVYDHKPDGLFMSFATHKSIVDQLNAEIAQLKATLKTSQIP